MHEEIFWSFHFPTLTKGSGSSYRSFQLAMQSREHVRNSGSSIKTFKQPYHYFHPWWVLNMYRSPKCNSQTCVPVPQKILESNAQHTRQGGPFIHNAWPYWNPILSVKASTFSTLYFWLLLTKKTRLKSSRLSLWNPTPATKVRNSRCYLYCGSGDWFQDCWFFFFLSLTSQRLPGEK